LHKQKFLTSGITTFLSLCRAATKGAARSDLVVMHRLDGTLLEYR
jgi:hypothetical protein